MAPETSRGNIGKYGPAVLGEDEYDRQQEAIEEMDEDTSRFGPRVLDEWKGREAEEEEVPESGPRSEEIDSRSELEEALPPGYEVEGGRGGYYTLKGPDGQKIEGSTESGKWGPGPGAALAAAREHYEAQRKQEETDDAAGAAEQLSLDELAAVLDRDPTQIDALTRAEFDRAEGPRPEGLQILMDAEESRDNPRPESLAALKRAYDEVTADLEEDEEEGGEE